jgi:hypothetical protein
MKKIAVVFCLLFSVLLCKAQAPPYINYQGVTRDNSGAPVSGNFTITFDINNGATVYSEKHSINTNALGLFNVKIGAGTQLSATNFSSINWANGPYNLAITINDGTNNVSLGSQQLVSVPYALYAQTSGSSVSPSLTINGNNLSISNGNTVMLPGGTDSQSLTLNSNSLSISNGNTVVLPSGGVPTASVTGSGAATVTTSGTNTFDVFVPPVNLTGQLGAIVTGAFPNYTVSTAIGTPPVIMGAGITTVVSAGNNFTVSTPPVGMTYNPGTGILSYSPSPGLSALDINPTVTFTNDVLTVGGNSVSVPLNGIWNRPNAITTMLTNQTDWVGIGNNNPISKLDVSDAGSNFISARSTGAFAGFLLDRPSISQAGYLIHQTAGSPMWTVGMHTNTPNYMIFNWANTRPDLSVNNSNGFVNIGNTNASENLQVENASGSTRISILAPSALSNALWFGTTGTHSLGSITYDNSSNLMNFGTNGGLNRLRIFANGDIAFGSTITPNPVGAHFIFTKPGNNYTRVLIAGGDGSNSMGGMLTLAENDYATQGMTMKMDALANRLIFTNEVTGNNANGVMSIGGYSGVNSGVLIGNGFVMGTPPVNGLAIQGNVGIGTAAPTNNLHVNGGVTITNGAQAVGRVLTSDASGNSTWAPVTTVTVASFNGAGLGSVGTTPTQLGPTLTSFTKQFADSKIDVSIQTHIHATDLNLTNSVRYEIRLTGNTPQGATGRVDYFMDNNGANNVSDYFAANFTGFFSGLATGSYNVEIWVYAVNAGGAASNVTINNGNFIGSVTIKEYR